MFVLLCSNVLIVCVFVCCLIISVPFACVACVLFLFKSQMSCALSVRSVVYVVGFRCVVCVLFV